MLNTKIKQSGFTIVELLIVIVVIAILAAISIVAYNGIQNRGKAAAAQSLANSIAKKVEAFNTVESTYPTGALLRANNGGGTASNPAEAKLDDNTVVVDWVTGTAAGQVGNAGTYLSGSKNLVVYRLTAATGSTAGGCVYYWDYSANTPAPVGVKVGSGTC